jgi:hypothetical protein
VTQARRSLALKLSCLLLLAGAGGGGWAAETYAGQPRLASICRVRHCRTIIASTKVAVIRAVSKRGAVVSYHSSYAQWRPTGRVTRLGDEETVTYSIVLGKVALTGAYMAYGLENLTGSEQLWTLCRLAISSGRRLCMQADANVSGALDGAVLSVVVAPNGTVGWIAGGGASKSGAHDVFLLGPNARKPVVVASSPTVDTGSLAVAPHQLYWTEAGAARSAPIP